MIHCYVKRHLVNLQQNTFELQSVHASQSSEVPRIETQRTPSLLGPYTYTPVRVGVGRTEFVEV